MAYSQRTDCSTIKYRRYVIFFVFQFWSELKFELTLSIDAIIIGVSAAHGDKTPCELAKAAIESKIMGITPTEDEHAMGDDDTEEDESNFRRRTEQRSLLDYFEVNESIPSLTTWLKSIKEDADISVQEMDDGDRDNIMFNEEFAKHFMKLCKLLPLWSGISCKIFGSTSVTSSSANAESYFKDVKHTLKDTIPCTADVFVQKHIDRIDELIITASRTYADTVGPMIGSRSDLSDEAMNIHSADMSSVSQQYAQEPNNITTYSVDDTDSDNESQASCTKVSKSIDPIACIACRDGNLPTGAHTCIDCGKMVHILPGCSYSIGTEEGYGSKRICAACHEKKKQLAQAQDIVEMNYEDEWAKKPKVKRSAYMKPNPAFNIMSETKKQKIGLLKNGNLAKKPQKVNNKTVQFLNTCAFDALVQAIAGAYAYYPTIRAYADETDQLTEIAVSLAKK